MSTESTNYLITHAGWELHVLCLNSGMVRAEVQVDLEMRDVQLTAKGPTLDEALAALEVQAKAWVDNHQD